MAHDENGVRQPEPGPNGGTLTKVLTPEEVQRIQDRGGKCAGVAAGMHRGYEVKGVVCSRIDNASGGGVEVYNVTLVRPTDGDGRLERFIFIEESRVLTPFRGG